ncbi:MAG: hypothetical protein IKW66_03585, partial [Clostridia bacterium]|nr:hypothetical protein [Clostridia bacterium]
MKFFTTSSTDAHTALRVRCAGMDALSLSFHKERAKERELKGLMPLRTPQDFSLSLSFGGYQKALSRQQFLRQRIKDPPPIASRLSLFTSFR